MTTEAKQLDALTLDEAKGILQQLGWFADDTCFLSMRLTAPQLANIQTALMTNVHLSPEEFLSELCKRHVIQQQDAALDTLARA